MVATIPDIERISRDWLRTYAGVTAITNRIVGQPATNTDTPWIKVTQLGARAVDGHRSDHLIDFLVQFDCYAGATGGQPEAMNLGRAVRRALVEMPDASHSAEVSAVDPDGPTRIPDPDVDTPPRERAVVTATIYAHA